MKMCNGCQFAEWEKTTAGRLHPNGDGKCLYEYVTPKLPGAFYWIGGDPTPCGGFINRRKEFDEHCVYYCRANQTAKEPK